MYHITVSNPLIITVTMYNGIYGPTNYEPFRLPNVYRPAVDLPGQPRPRRSPPPCVPFRRPYPCVPTGDPPPYRGFPPIFSRRLSERGRDMAYSGWPPERPRETVQRLNASVDAMYHQMQADKEKKTAEQARAAKQARAQRRAATRTNTESSNKPEVPEGPKVLKTPKKPSTPKTKGSRPISKRKARLRSFRHMLRD